jgi:hypothetical protein
MLVKRRNIGAHGIASVYEGRTPTTAKILRLNKDWQQNFQTFKDNPT